MNQENTFSVHVVWLSCKIIILTSEGEKDRFRVKQFSLPELNSGEIQGKKT